MNRVPVLLTLAETLERLPVSRMTLHKLVQSGQLRTVVVGRRRFVAEDDLGAFIEAHTEGGVA